MADVSPIIPTPPTSHYALSLFLDALVAVFSFIRSIHWSLRLSQLFSLLALPFRLILYPVRFILSIFLTLFAPAIYVASFCMSGVHAVTSFLASLEVRGPVSKVSRPTPANILLIAVVHICKKLLLLLVRVRANDPRDFV